MTTASSDTASSGAMPGDASSAATAQISKFITFNHEHEWAMTLS